MIEVLQADNLSACQGVRHAFFTRLGGVSEGLYAGLNAGRTGVDRPDHVEENRRRIAAHLDITPERLIGVQQIHSARVVTVTAPWKTQERPEADGLVTDKPNLALNILTADCAPVLFADPSGGVIGAAHAGWRGAVGGVLENTLAAMENLGAHRSRICAAIGPCIGKKSYEVDAAFPAPFMDERPENAVFFTPEGDEHFMFDLPGYIVAKLEYLGLASVTPSPADTCADAERFFSYRRSCLMGHKGETGRLISAIMLV